MSTLRLARFKISVPFSDGKKRCFEYFFLFKLINKEPKDENFLEQITNEVISSIEREVSFAGDYTKEVFSPNLREHDHPVLCDFSGKTDSYIKEGKIDLVDKSGNCVEIAYRIVSNQLDTEESLEYAERLIPFYVITNIVDIIKHVMKVKFL